MLYNIYTQYDKNKPLIIKRLRVLLDKTLKHY